MYSKCQRRSKTGIWQHRIVDNKVTAEGIGGVGRCSSTTHKKRAVCSWVARVKRNLPIYTDRRPQVPKEENRERKKEGRGNRLGGGLGMLWARWARY